MNLGNAISTYFISSSESALSPSMSGGNPSEYRTAQNDITLGRVIPSSVCLEYPNNPTCIFLALLLGTNIAKLFTSGAISISCLL